MLIYLGSLSSVFYEIVPYYVNYAKLIACERSGVQPGGMVCDRSGNQNVAFPAFLTLMIATICIFPIANLIYAINVQEVKGWYRRLTKLSEDGKKSTTSNVQGDNSTKAIKSKLSPQSLKQAY